MTADEPTEQPTEQPTDPPPRSEHPADGERPTSARDVMATALVSALGLVLIARLPLA